MRVIWAGFLTVGLILIGLSVYDGLKAGTEPVVSGVSACEDGTPMPQPTPTPRPKLQ